MATIGDETQDARLKRFYDRAWKILDEHVHCDTNKGCDCEVLDEVLDELVAEARAAARAPLEERVRSLLAEVERTKAWRSTTGVRTASDASDFANVLPSGLIAIERALLAALAEPPEEVCATCHDSEEVEAPFSDTLDYGPSYMPCPDCQPAIDQTDEEGEWEYRAPIGGAMRSVSKYGAWRPGAQRRRVSAWEPVEEVSE